MSGFSRFLKLFGELAYRRSPPWDSEDPAPELVELIEGPAPRRPGRALDLGCGTGTNAVYLARHGWDVTGVDLVHNAVAAARAKAAAAGVSITLVEGDVTHLDQLGVGDGYTLVTDFGCFHGVPYAQRDAYAAQVTAVAMPGAVLVLLGMGRLARLGVDADEIRRRFPRWRLRRATQLGRHDFFARFRSSSLLIRALRRSRLRIWWFELERVAESGGRS